MRPSSNAVVKYIVSMHAEKPYVRFDMMLVTEELSQRKYIFRQEGFVPFL